MIDPIERADAIKALKDAVVEMGGDDFCEMGVHVDDIDSVINAIPSADRPQGYWIKVYIATYRCSECGKTQIADDENELNYCCCCGSHNKIRKVIGADDDH